MNPIIEAYFKILSKQYPTFINAYLEVPCIQRLKGIGLFCGTDWTNLYHHKFFYSRYYHSIGVALIIWHFTHDKKQTLAGLFHDVSSPIFSHVVDFKNNDYLEQVSTESLNTTILKNDQMLQLILKKEGIDFKDICDYHQYPIADNTMPKLSADRLEYMFSTGLVMADIFDLKSIEKYYQNIIISTNEENCIELAFTKEEVAVEYCCRCCKVGKLYLTNKNKLALQLLATITDQAIALGAIKEEDMYVLTEQEVMKIFEGIDDSTFQKYLQSFIQATSIMESETIIDNTFYIHLDVKKRYIDPLWQTKRISLVNTKANHAIQSLLTYTTPKYASIYLK